MDMYNILEKNIKFIDNTLDNFRYVASDNDN